jgi:hypothetical protein
VTIANLGQLGNTAHAASASSVTHTTATTNMVAGDCGVLFVVTDNIAAVDGNNNEHTSVTGGTGVWTKVSEYTNSNAGAGNGVTISLWIFNSTGTNSIGTVFTINFSGAIVEKALTMHGYSKATGTLLVASAEPGTNPITSQVDAANDFGSSAFAGLASASRLYFRAMGKEANSVTDITPSTNFTVTGRTRSQNAASAVFSRGEYRINTSTGETSNPTLAVSGDTAGLFAAFVESTSGTDADTLDPVTSTSSSTMGITGTGAATLGAVTSTSAGGGGAMSHRVGWDVFTSTIEGCIPNPMLVL